MSNETLPALVARVRGEGERLLALKAKATRGPYGVGRTDDNRPVITADDGEPNEPWHLAEMARGASYDVVADPVAANAEMFVALANSALPADALALARRAERLEAACRFALDVVGRQSAFYGGDAMLARLTLDIEAALAGEPAEGDAGGRGDDG
jgi:hypothetical protein